MFNKHMDLVIFFSHISRIKALNKQKENIEHKIGEKKAITIIII